MPETTFQPDGTAGIDTYIKEDSATSNYGSLEYLHIGHDTAGDNRDMLIKFDLSEIVRGSTIEEATLTLTAYSNIGSGSSGVYIRRILDGNADWTESGATWNKKDGTDDWAGSVGCETVGTDIAVASLFEDGSFSWNLTGDNDFDLNPSEFQALINVGNYGIKVYSPNRVGGSDRFVYCRSSDYGTAGDRPELYVRWIEPSARAYKYTLDIWDPLTRIRDETGKVVPYEELEPDNWLHLDGLFLPSGEVYDSLLTDPAKVYIAGVRYDEDANTVQLIPNKNLFVDKLLRGITGGI